ncbi:hypothetical protein KBZ14_13830 [Synechococcus sp. HJ21-Hayes]|jgi:hypothetical protein|uniref:hypothetical protein n=1 Tax=unclassified Synechococcus TaxID=2626047 RepID=UPI0020CEC6EC|nr:MULTISPECIES: hypothetical protein [unclassified Synechococcus]MCP9832352.1 hypothetical protein [Synechococcus sp. JJ3a-Johnson]MCP9853938.1 hypothetical protein [Synechococcus sp. HJ21-Hayes]
MKYSRFWPLFGIQAIAMRATVVAAFNVTSHIPLQSVLPFPGRIFSPLGLLSQKPLNGTKAERVLEDDGMDIVNVRKCLEQEVQTPLRSEDDSLKQVIRDLMLKCVERTGLRNAWVVGLPFTVAIHAKTNKEVQLKYFCSDVCPTMGRVFATLAGVSKKECCALGQLPITDSAWGGYIGCQPLELVSDLDKKYTSCSTLSQPN